MKKSNTLSSAELTVMQILWKHNKPLTVSEVCEELESENWEYRTVATLLLRMKEKGAVVSEKRNNVNFYTPIIEKKEYTEAQTKSFVQKLYNGSAKELAVSLFRSDELSKEDIEDIRKMFNL